MVGCVTAGDNGGRALGCKETWPNNLRLRLLNTRVPSGVVFTPLLQPAQRSDAVTDVVHNGKRDYDKSEKGGRNNNKA